MTGDGGVMLLGQVDRKRGAPTFSLGFGTHGKRELSSDDIVCN